MNQELQTKILELLGKAEEFTIDTAPLVVQDVLTWAQLAWVFPASGLVCSGTALCLVGRVLWKKLDDEKACLNDEETPWGIATIVLSGITFGTLLATIVKVYQAIHATVAPYSYLVSLAS